MIERIAVRTTQLGSKGQIVVVTIPMKPLDFPDSPATYVTIGCTLPSNRGLSASVMIIIIPRR